MKAGSKTDLSETGLDIMYAAEQCAEFQKVEHASGSLAAARSPESFAC